MLQVAHTTACTHCPSNTSPVWILLLRGPRCEQLAFGRLAVHHDRASAIAAAASHILHPLTCAVLLWSTDEGLLVCNVQAHLGLRSHLLIFGKPHLCVLGSLCQADSREGACAGGMPCQKLNICGAVLHPHASGWSALQTLLRSSQEPATAVSARLLWCVQHGEWMP